MVRVLTKDANNEYEERYISHKDLVDWFDFHSDKDGNVDEDIVVYDTLEIKADGDAVQWTLSDYTLDRDNERIDPAGWNLKQFKANPVVLWAHDAYRPAIGKVEGIKKADGALVGRVVFDMDDEFAATISGKVDKGILTKGSVGFRSLQIEIVDDGKEKADLIHRKQELYEFSVVNIPSNPNASVSRGLLPGIEEPFKAVDEQVEDYEADDRIERFVAETDLEYAATAVGETKLNYLDTLFYDGPVETRREQVRETSELDHMLYDGHEETDTIEELLT